MIGEMLTPASCTALPYLEALWPRWITRRQRGSIEPRARPASLNAAHSINMAGIHGLSDRLV